MPSDVFKRPPSSVGSDSIWFDTGSLQCHDDLFHLIGSRIFPSDKIDEIPKDYTESN
jgi:hypothetical protein